MTTATEAPDLKAMVAPGQEDVVEQFLQELDQQDAAIAAAEDPQEEKLLAGKFKSAEELEKAYLEAQRLIGSRGQKAEPEPEAQPLTREQATERYGEFIASAAEEEGLDLGAWDQKVRKGEDTKELREKLAAKTNIPVQLIEQYEAAFRPQANPPAEPDSSAQGLSDADVVELKGLVGGDQEFARLSRWASENLGADELADYNEAVETGNKTAVRLALRAMAARSAATPGEPELIGGVRAPRGEVFESQQAAVEAMRKTNARGQNLYRNDPKYREWFDRTLARSTFAS